MFIYIKDIPPDIVKKFNLNEIAINGKVYVEILKGMYGLSQAGILANELLLNNLAKFGYYQCKHTPGLWKHKTRPIVFVLVVDDFGVFCFSNFCSAEVNLFAAITACSIGWSTGDLHKCG